jgi:hypothetical protein
MSEVRHAYTIFCDDIRAEVGNKLSLMGCYDSVMLVSQFPITLPKLCFLMTATTPSDRPFQQLKFRLYKNEELLHELEIDANQLGMQHSAKTPTTMEEDVKSLRAMRGAMQLSPLTIEGPCYFKVRVVTEEEHPLRGGALLITTASNGDSPPQLTMPMG